MCEQLVARSADPFRLDALWPLVERLERFGVAGFGWGAAWLAPDGTLGAHRDTRAFRDDPARDRLGDVETTSLLVHLRRPSRLSTIQLADTQPFLDPAGRFALSHNGEHTSHAAARERYRRDGRIHGRADSEVGQRWLEDAWPGHARPATPRPPGGTRPGDAAPGRLLARLHAELGGVANLAVLAADGSVHHYAGNPENPVFTYRLGAIGVASTGLYSIDRSLFRLAATGASGRHLVRPGHSVTLDASGGHVQEVSRGGAGPADWR